MMVSFLSWKKKIELRYKETKISKEKSHVVCGLTSLWTEGTKIGSK